ncbi:cytochrome P450 [Bradyrhizobium sp. HKCCYLS1011]|uniref:cytochrome P450 n=1 Tax=Bradyrhizobium sp. HKCCYLS1011 TaxID=3420733 RepID=UPI003EBFF0F2
MSHANSTVSLSTGAPPTIAELEADPHGVMRHWRALTPAIPHDGYGFLILRATDVDRLINDARLRPLGTELARLRGITEGTLFEFFSEGMLTADGAVHRRRRSPFTRAFAARLMTELRPQLRRSAESLIEAWEPGETIDFVAGFASRLPAQAIAGLLGLPLRDIPRFTELAYSASRLLSFSYAPEDIPGMEADMTGLRTYAEELLADRRAAPRDDFLSTFLHDAEQEGELSPAEIVVQVITMIIGGTDTTRGAMASQLASLLQHRAQWQAVCRDPALVRPAVNEALRYEPSVASTSRLAQEDIDLDGVKLPAGQLITFALISALRDERVYKDPDVFDIHRTDHVRLHPVFGAGPHRCLGEALARAELEEGLAALAARVPDLEMVGEPFSLRGHFGIRRVGAMRVRRPH